MDSNEEIIEGLSSSSPFTDYESLLERFFNNEMVWIKSFYKELEVGIKLAKSIKILKWFWIDVYIRPERQITRIKLKEPFFDDSVVVLWEEAFGFNLPHLINGIGIGEQYQKRGIATCLYHFLDKLTQRRGKRWLVTTYPFNPKILSIYKKIFKEIEIKPLNPFFSSLISFIGKKLFEIDSICKLEYSRQWIPIDALDLGTLESTSFLLTKAIRGSNQNNLKGEKTASSSSLKVCIQNTPNYKEKALKEMIKLVKETDIEGIEFVLSLEIMEYLKKLKKEVLELKERGICIQTHAPVGVNPVIPYHREILFQALETSKLLEAEVMTLHPEGKIEEFAGYLYLLAKKAKEFNIKIAVENTPGFKPQKMNKLFERLEIISKITKFKDIPFYVGICFDIGHAHIRGNPVNYLKKLNPSIKIYNVHIHDNWGDEDEHLRIGKGIIDFREVFEELSRREYSENMVMEYQTDKVSFIEDMQLIKKWWRLSQEKRKSSSSIDFDNFNKQRKEDKRDKIEVWTEDIVIFLKNLIKKIETERENKKLFIKKLCLYLDIPPTTYQGWREGRTPIQSFYLKKLVDYFNLEERFSDEENKLWQKYQEMTPKDLKYLVKISSVPYSLVRKVIETLREIKDIDLKKISTNKGIPLILLKQWKDKTKIPLHPLYLKKIIEELNLRSLLSEEEKNWLENKWEEIEIRKAIIPYYKRVGEATLREVARKLGVSYESVRLDTLKIARKIKWIVLAEEHNLIDLTEEGPKLLKKLNIHTLTFEEIEILFRCGIFDRRVYKVLKKLLEYRRKNPQEFIKEDILSKIKTKGVGKKTIEKIKSYIEFD